MKNTDLLNKLQSAATPLLLDGAMGTLIHARGINFDESFDELNLSNPALIADIHRSYIDAGAEIILTNTFGANRYQLDKHGQENQVAEINQAGVDLVRRVASAAFKDVYIAGDVGPLGVPLAPFGRVQLEQAREAFREQIQALHDAGADMIFLETFTDLYELLEGVKAAKDVEPDMPVVASMTFTRDNRTVLGNTPAEVAQSLNEAGATVIGVNCSGGPTQLLRILKQMKKAVPGARFMIKPNAGLPEQVGGRIMYPAGPSYFAGYVNEFRKAGACLIGGCCGTTPDHISHMRHVLDQPYIEEEFTGNGVQVITPKEDLPPRERPTGLADALKAKKFVATVEMHPPRGVGTEKVLAAASMLKEAGATCVNIADSPMARMRMSPWAVSSLIQERLDIETILHFPTRGRNLLRVQGDLLAAHALDVRNLFVVMGDPTSIGDYPDATDDYDIVPSGLLKLIKQSFNEGTDYAGSEIGVPTNFFAGCALNLTPAKPERELKVLRRKLANGADFALTQPIFSPKDAENFIKSCTDEIEDFDLPLIVGILPLANERHASFLHNELPGVSIPEEHRNRIEQAEDKQAEGIKIAIELIEQIKPWVDGVYIMPPFRRYEIAAEIIEKVA
jgi:homocysteine S-methyltransferase